MLKRIFKQTKSGSALLIVIFILGGIFLVAFGVGYMVFFTLKNGDNQANAYRAYYAAEAGVERARYEAKNNNISACPGRNIFGTQVLSNLSAYQINCDDTSAPGTLNILGGYKQTQILNQVSLATLLLPLSGAQSSTNFVDTSIFNRTVTTSGNPIILSTTYGAFGTSSAYFDGQSYLTFGSDTSLYLGNVFTIDTWIKTATSSGVIFSNINTSPIVGNIGVIFGLGLNNVNPGQLSLYTAEAYNSPEYLYSTGTINDDHWHHVAIVKNASKVYFFIDGNLDSTSVSSLSYEGGGAVNIAYNGWSGGPEYFSGRLAQLRVLKGQATWTSSFVLPIAPYSR